MRNSIKIITTGLTMTMAVLLSTVVFAANPKTIVDKSQKATKLKGAEAVSTMTIFDAKGRKRVRKIAQVTKLFRRGKLEKRLIRFLSPADVKGTGLLTFDYDKRDDDMWLFMPALRKTRRIVSSEKAKNFMGSEFSYADITPPVLNDFKYTLLKEESVGGISCWVIEIIPKNDDIVDENGFSKKIAYIAKQDYVIRKAVYYDEDGELQKEMTVTSVKLIDKRNKKYRPMHMLMVNKQNGRKSIMKINKIKFNPRVKSSYFTTRYLERP